jgi:hypothetical protein
MSHVLKSHYQEDVNQPDLFEASFLLPVCAMATAWLKVKLAKRGRCM